MATKEEGCYWFIPGYDAKKGPEKTNQNANSYKHKKTRFFFIY